MRRFNYTQQTLHSWHFFFERKKEQKLNFEIILN